jgi:hypothetical protein
MIAFPISEHVAECLLYHHVRHPLFRLWRLIQADFISSKGMVSHDLLSERICAHSEQDSCCGGDILHRPGDRLLVRLVSPHSLFHTIRLFRGNFVGCTMNDNWGTRASTMYPQRVFLDENFSLFYEVDFKLLAAG